MENKQIHIVQKSGGCYEDSYHYIIGVWPTFDEAMKQAKEKCKEYVVDESKLPMTFDEFINCNYGYPDDPWGSDSEHNYTEDDDKFLSTIIDRDGHTIDEFKVMSEAWEKTMDDFSGCFIETFTIGVPNDKEKATAYVTNDPNNYGEFIINKY